jgi:hypothetical protein
LVRAKAVFLPPVAVKCYNRSRTVLVHHIAYHHGWWFTISLNKFMKNIKFISLKNLFRDEVRSEPTVSLNNSLELLALSTKIG